MLEPVMMSVLSNTLGFVSLTKIKVWAVFLLCLLFSGLGVGLSFLAFGATITGYKLWGLGFAIALIMLGITYGAKYANKNSREEFTPIDLIQFTGQGFLWPSTWPGLAKQFGVETIDPPITTTELILTTSQISF